MLTLAIFSRPDGQGGGIKRKRKSEKEQKKNTHTTNRLPHISKLLWPPSAGLPRRSPWRTRQWRRHRPRKCVRSSGRPLRPRLRRLTGQEAHDQGGCSVCPAGFTSFDPNLRGPMIKSSWRLSALWLGAIFHGPAPGPSAYATRIEACAGAARNARFEAFAEQSDLVKSSDADIECPSRPRLPCGEVSLWRWREFGGVSRPCRGSYTPPRRSPRGSNGARVARGSCQVAGEGCQAGLHLSFTSPSVQVVITCGPEGAAALANTSEKQQNDCYSSRFEATAYFRDPSGPGARSLRAA